MGGAEAAGGRTVETAAGEAGGKSCGSCPDFPNRGATRFGNLVLRVFPFSEAECLE